jgi:hypothetical protein
MYTAGVILLVVAAILLAAFSHTLFFGDGRTVGFLDFSGVYYWAQWIGFWSAAASLAAFVLCARLAPLPLLSPRGLAPALAVALCVHFLIYSIPEASNKDGWRKGAVGWKVYMDTKRRIWAEERADASLKGAFRGKWSAAGSVRLEIGEGHIVLTNRGTAQEFSEDRCPGSSYLAYRVEDRHGVGYHFYRAGMLRSPLYSDLPEGGYPILTFTCNGQETAFLAIGPRRLAAVLPDGALLTFTR